MGVIERLSGLLRRDQTPLDPFRQLINIAKGRARFPDMIDKREILIHQLRAIEELGNTGRWEALVFLNGLYKKKLYASHDWWPEKH